MTPSRSDQERPWLVVLGSAQDGGFPQAGCHAHCCLTARRVPSIQRSPCSMALVDPVTQSRWLLDCSPAFPQQLAILDGYSEASWGIAGIFLTHAHMGHYTGLLQLGREVMASRQLNVYVMPKMLHFLQTNSPWRQLIEQKHIQLQPISKDQSVVLGEDLSITPREVPHRGEISETVAFEVQGPSRGALYLPDIDGWEDWSLEQVLPRVDRAWVDGTFFDYQELPHRNRGEIPHPCMTESIAAWQELSQQDRQKIHFTHLNHSNPVCLPQSEEARWVREQGYEITREGEVFGL